MNEADKRFLERGGTIVTIGGPDGVATATGEAQVISGDRQFLNSHCLDEKDSAEFLRQAFSPWLLEQGKRFQETLDDLLEGMEVPRD